MLNCFVHREVEVEKEDEDEDEDEAACSRAIDELRLLMSLVSNSRLLGRTDSRSRPSYLALFGCSHSFDLASVADISAIERLSDMVFAVPGSPCESCDVEACGRSKSVDVEQRSRTNCD
jgi:hypothetical protein